MDRLGRPSSSPPGLVEAIERHAMVARRGDVVIITSRPDWTPEQVVGYMQQLHLITLALGLQFSFMIVHGESVEIERPAGVEGADVKRQG